MKIIYHIQYIVQYTIVQYNYYKTFNYSLKVWACKIIIQNIL